jgi:protein O-mannosyl-transferase
MSENSVPLTSEKPCIPRRWNLAWLSNWPGLLLMSFVALLVYDPVLQGTFVWDDQDWTTGLPVLRDGIQGLRNIWLNPSALQQYYPLTATSFWIDHQLWGFNTLPYHVENVLLHALSAWLFLRLLKRLEVPGAELAAWIFLLHPVMVESVAWITERKNVLSLPLFLCALLVYGRIAAWWETPQRSCAARWAIGSLAFLLLGGALAAKVTAMVFPAVVLLLTWWKRGRIHWKFDVLPTLPFIALAVAFAEQVHWQEHYQVGARGTEFLLAADERVAIAGKAFWFYPAKLLWPADLCFVYPRWTLNSGDAGYWFRPFAATLALVGVWLANKKIGRGPFVALAFYAVAISPLLGFFDIFSSRYSFVWDHWVYLPSLGLFAFFAAVVSRFVNSSKAPRLMGFLTLALLAVLGFCASKQSTQFKSMEALWRTTIERNPDCWMAHYNLALDLDQQGWLEEAIPHYEKAVMIEPKRAELYNNLGSALIQKGDIAGATMLYQEAVRINPNDPQLCWNLGTVLIQQKKLEEALVPYRRTLELDPDSMIFRKALGSLLLEQGRHEETVKVLKPAVEKQPADAEIRYNLATALMRMDKLEEAAAQYEETLKLQPADADAFFNLGNVRMRQQRPDLAEAAYRKALPLKQDDAVLHNNLGWTLQKSGRAKEALAEYGAALKVDPKLALAHRNTAWILATTPDDAIRDGAKALAHAKEAEAAATEPDLLTLIALGAAQAETKDFASAMKTAERAREMALKQNNQKQLAAIMAQETFYAASQPLRDQSLKTISS